MKHTNRGLVVPNLKPHYGIQLYITFCLSMCSWNVISNFDFVIHIFYFTKSNLFGYI